MQSYSNASFLKAVQKLRMKIVNLETILETKLDDVKRQRISTQIESCKEHASVLLDDIGSEDIEEHVVDA